MFTQIFDSLFFALSYDETHHWLQAEWQGTHDAASSLASCAVIMRHVEIRHCSRLLCDSSLSYDGWSEIDQWIGTSYFPKLSAAGIKAVAWINAKDWQTSAVITLMLQESTQPVVALFEEGIYAYDWLLRQPNT